MISERYMVQEFFHQKLGAPSPEEYKSKKSTFLSLALTKRDVEVLQENAKKDSIFYYQKGVQSLCEGVLDLSRRCFSWATVKLYYSLFYFLRASTIHYNYSFIRWIKLYYISLSEYSKPTDNLLGRIRNDHSFTCNFFIKLIANDDIFTTNTIDDKYAYIWLMEQREYANYRARYFADPSPWECWVHFDSIDKTKLNSYIMDFVSDAKERKFLFCFLPDYACLALPIARAVETKRLLDTCMNCDDEILSTGKKFIRQTDSNKILQELIDHLVVH